MISPSFHYWQILLHLLTIFSSAKGSTYPSPKADMCDSSPLHTHVQRKAPRKHICLPRKCEYINQVLAFPTSSFPYLSLAVLIKSSTISIQPFCTPLLKQLTCCTAAFCLYARPSLPLSLVDCDLLKVRELICMCLFFQHLMPAEWREKRLMSKRMNLV